MKTPGCFVPERQYTEDYGAAADEYSKAWEGDESAPAWEVRRNRGLAYLKSGRYTEAVTDFEDGLARYTCTDYY